MAPSKGDRTTNGSPRSEAIVRGLSTLLDRLGFANRAGLAFGGRRDYDVSLGYLDRLEPADYRYRYERNGIARRIVRFLPDATWSGGASLIENDDPEQVTAFEESFASLVDRLSVWSRLRRVDTLSRLGRFGVLLIGAPGDLRDDLPRMSGPEDVLYLQAFSEEAISGIEFETDVSSERFGMPKEYAVSIGAPQFVSGDSSRVRTETRLIHWTRVIHVAEDLLDDEVYGDPVLRDIWNYLDDLLKVVGGGAEAAWKRADPGLNLAADKDLILDPEEVAALEEDVADYIHGLTRVVRTRGVEMNMLQSQVAGFSGNADLLLKLIAAAKGIPGRILTGSERGELASSQDRQNLQERVGDRRTYFAEPLVRDLVDRFVAHGVLPEPADGYDVEWAESDELDEAEKAQVASTLTAANANEARASGQTVITPAEIRDRILGLAPIDDAGGADAVESLRVAKLRRLHRARRSVASVRSARHDKASIDQAVDRGTRRISTAVSSSWVAGAAAVSEGELAKRLESRDMPSVNALIADVAQAAGDALGPAFFDSVLETLVDGAETELDRARDRGTFVSAQVEMSFDATNPRAIAFAEAASARLVVEVRPEIAAALRELVSFGLAEGVPPTVLARDVRQLVGLRSDQIQARSNLMAELRSVEPGTTVSRFPPQPTLRDAPGFRARVPSEGATDAWVRRQLERYSAMQLNLRSRTIARTEAARAVNAGVRELWRQAVEQRQLAPDARRVWITAGDEAVRDSHAELEGEVVGIDEPFSGGFEPGEEPNCRCGHGIAGPGDIARFASRREEGV